MSLHGIPLSRSIIHNLLWLVFALSFLWFPYIGMVTFPCRSSGNQEKLRASKYRHTMPVERDAVEYTKLGIWCRCSDWKIVFTL